MNTTEFRAMGSRIFLAMDSDRDPWPDLREGVIARFEAWEQSLSRFRSASELSVFNRRLGERVQVSEPFWQVLTLALRTAEKTNGIVTPAVLDALEAAGYDVTFEDIGDRADQWLRQPINQPVSLKDIELDESSHTVKMPKGLRLDFGGVAKGWAAHQTMLSLKQYGPVLVDAGGDISVSGPMRDGSAWPVGITDPFNPNGSLALLMLSGGGVATSGRDYRRWQLHGRTQHHLIDPRINAPAETDVLTVTVIAEDVIQAEALSKHLLILGSSESAAIVDDTSNNAFFLVLDDGRTIESNHFSLYKWNETWTTTKKAITA